MSKGEGYPLKRTFQGRTIERVIRLISVKEYWEPDFWTGSKDRRTLRMAEVTVDVSGVARTLKCRPYQMPMRVNGLRVYVESTDRWANSATYAALSGMESDVRLSVVAEGEAWGPNSFVFPIERYRWRSSTYNNTWLSLVPYNRLYYHRGEDFGAIPDCLAVVAALDGKVVTTPLPDGDGKSNSIVLQTVSGVRLRYAHMNIETVDRSLTVGHEVFAGTRLCKTGMTWSGRKSQENDPHLHFGMEFGDTCVSPYPAIVESYFRSYPDKIIAVAGGYHFATPGTEIKLDGSRSVARPGHWIGEYEWRLHNGGTAHTAELRLTFDSPGLYSEELIVRTQNGHEDRDFAQVRVYDPKRGRRMVTGWIHYRPVRGIHARTPVVFWNRLSGGTTGVQVDFGDGSRKQVIKKMTEHAYESPGIYTVTFSTRGPNHEPATVRTRVVVEQAKG